MIKDFTLQQYSRYLRAIKSNYPSPMRFDEYMAVKVKPESFCMIRHDVDRKPQNALDMAKLESSLGMNAVYYFRMKSNTFKPAIIQEIAALGHEVGYHYECLSDTDGDFDKALLDFEENLAKMREIVPVKTISMHGRPFKPYDNRDLWRKPENHQLLQAKFGILGEVYLDIDYTDIAYVNDTGRNWTAGKANRRDHVNSQVPADFQSATELLTYLQEQPHPKLVFQIHPERWTDKQLEHTVQACKDGVINLIKAVI